MYGEFADLTPLRANITPEDVGGTALYLASDLSSAVTGDTYYVDGGFSIMGVPTGELTAARDLPRGPPTSPSSRARP